MQRLAIIGGTGLLNMATGQPFADAGIEVLSTDSFEVETPYGNVPLKSFAFNTSPKRKHSSFSNGIIMKESPTSRHIISIIMPTFGP